MAIKIRRGKYSDYDPSKLVSGELAVVLEGDPNSKTGRSLYVCFQPGTVKRIVDYDDLVDLLANASDTYVEKISDEYLSNINTATDSANKAASSATAASESATSAAGNANKAASEASTQAERAETALAGLGSAITSDKVKNNLTTMDAGYVLDARQGKVLNDKFGSYVPTANIVDNLTTASSSKVLSANQGKALADRMTTVETDINSPTAVTDPADKTVLLSGGSGIDYAKLADAIIARYNANGLINNVTTSTAAQGALDAAQGKALYDLISANKTDISSLNSGLTKKWYESTSINPSWTLNDLVSGKIYAVIVNVCGIPTVSSAAHEIWITLNGSEIGRSTASGYHNATFLLQSSKGDVLSVRSFLNNGTWSSMITRIICIPLA